MNRHEYRAKHLVSRYLIPVAQGDVAVSVAEAVSIARQLGGGPGVDPGLDPGVDPGLEPGSGTDRAG